MGTITLNYNGGAFTSIPGTPTAGDKFSMANGTCRLNFVYGTPRTGTWFADSVDYSLDGSTYTTMLYAKEGARFETPYSGSTNVGITNGVLTMITNNAPTNVTVQVQSTATVSTSVPTANTVFTSTQRYTMTSSFPNIEVTQWLATSNACTLTSGQLIEDWGAAHWVTGLQSSCNAFFNGMGSPYGNPRALPLYYTNNVTMLKSGRYFGRSGNNSNRGYSGGVSLYLTPSTTFTSGLLVAFVIKPASYQSLLLNVVDANNSAAKYQSEVEFTFTYRGNTNYVRGSDGAYLTQVDPALPTWVRPGTNFNNQGYGATGVTSVSYPAATSATATDGTVMNLTWSLAIDVPSVAALATNNTVQRWALPQIVNKYIDILYPRPTILGSGYTQTLPQLAATITPVIRSTAIASATYGYYLQATGGTQYTSWTAIIGLQTALRWLNLGITANSENQTAADTFAGIIANYWQSNSGNVQYGAIYKVRDTNGNKFLCQEPGHATNTDQPHVATYIMAEAVNALIEYYQVRGNQTLNGTALATILDTACAYFVLVQQTDGGWLVEYNNTNTYTTQNTQWTGSRSPGASAPDISASLLQWAGLSPTATTTQKSAWTIAAHHGLSYTLLSESAAHGCFEYGESEVNHSHYGTRMLVRGLLRWYKMTGSQICLEHALYYFEIVFLLCKKIDEVINNTNSNSVDVHTGGLISTIDWGGVVGGEAAADWAIYFTEVLHVHPTITTMNYYWFYFWAQTQVIPSWYRDRSTGTTSFAYSLCYASPGTSFAGNNYGLDITQFTYFAAFASLFNIAVNDLVRTSNALVFAACLEANLVTSKPVGRTIMIANPQTSSQTTTLTIVGQAGKSATQDGTRITTTTSGFDLQVTVTLTTNQVSRIVVK